MLDGIRANASNWGVKLAFGIIIVVFVFWGIGSYNGSTGIVASVKGKIITEREFLRQYQQEMANLRRNTTYPPEILEMIKPQIRFQVLNALAERKLLQAESERTGISVSPFELRRYLETVPELQDSNGRLDSTRYLELVKAQGMTVSNFENDLQQDMLPQKFMELIVAGAFVPESTVSAFFNYINEARSINYIFFPSANHLDQSKPTEAEIIAAYENSKGDYTILAKTTLEYIEISAAKLADPSRISNEETAVVYQRRIAQYSTPEMIKARHILIRADQTATEAEISSAKDRIELVAARIQAGEDFGTVAAEISEDASAAQGGDLGWFSQAQMQTNKTFAEAAFAMQPGEVAGPIKTSFGFHLIKVEGRQAAEVKSLDEVQESLRQELASETASRDLQNTADTILGQARSGKPMQETAASFGLQAVTSAPLTAEDLAQNFHLQASDIQAILAASPGTVLNGTLTTPSSLMVAKVIDSTPVGTFSLDEVREELAAKLSQTKALELAAQEAEEFLAKLAADNESPPAEKIETSPLFRRDGAIGEFGTSTELLQAVFELPRSEAGQIKWLPKAFIVDDGAILTYLAEVVAPSEEIWQAEATLYQYALRQQRMEDFNRIFRAKLGKDVQIERINQEFLNNLRI